MASRQADCCSKDNQHLPGLREWLPGLVLLTLEGAKRHLANWLKGENPDVLSRTLASSTRGRSRVMDSVSVRV